MTEILDRVRELLLVSLLIAACGGGEEPDAPDATTASACEIRAETLCTMRAECSDYDQQQVDRCLESEIRFCGGGDYTLESALDCAERAPELEPCRGQYYPPDTCRVYPAGGAP